MNMYCMHCEYLNKCDRTEKERRKCAELNISEFKDIIKDLEYKISDLSCIIKDLKDYERIRSLIFLLIDAAQLVKFDLEDASK